MSALKFELPDVEGEWSINCIPSILSSDIVDVTLTLKTGVNTYKETYPIELGRTSVEELNEALEGIAQRLSLRSQMFTHLNNLSNQFPLKN